MGMPQNKHFQKYLNTLPHDNRYAIKKKHRNHEILDSYVGATEELCCPEIMEIEEAASYRFKYYVKPEYLMEISEIPDNTEENFVESFEEDFKSMLEMLEVTWNRKVETDSEEMAQIQGRIEQFERIKYKTAKGLIYSPERYKRRK